METITFYSYKGGVGRTLALANIAMYLRRFGLNVCLLDFDLEAPGLHYKFTKYLKTDDIKSGLLDYIHEFTQKRDMPEDFVPFSIEIALKTERYGSIHLIPAGNVLSREYWKKLASLDWHSMFYREDSEGVPFFLELKERIEIEFKSDFLLIDSRTGVTEMGGVCTALLPDKIVFFIANNQENIDGACQIIKGIKKVKRLPGQKPIEVILVITRIPFDKDETRKSQIVDNVLNILNKDFGEPENQLDVQDICVIHSDRELEFSESLRFDKNRLDIETSLTYDYQRFFLKLLSKDFISANIDKIINILDNTDSLSYDKDQVKSILETLSSTIKCPRAFERLIDFYIRNNELAGPIRNAFYELKEISDTIDPKILSKVRKYL
jgi:MinD-like ATPase involved in chromosome partitioning or flagellar assembly